VHRERGRIPHSPLGSTARLGWDRPVPAASPAAAQRIAEDPEAHLGRSEDLAGRAGGR